MTKQEISITNAVIDCILDGNSRKISFGVFPSFSNHIVVSNSRMESISVWDSCTCELTSYQVGTTAIEQICNLIDEFQFTIDVIGYHKLSD